MIDWAIKHLVARFHRWRLMRGKRSPQWMYEWVRDNPGRCLYCSYTRWCWSEHRIGLPMEGHRCPEGRGGRGDLPVARALPERAT